MPRRRLVNLLLLCLVLVLGGLVWLTQEQQVNGAFKPLSGIDPASIGQIRLHNRNGADISLEQRENGWWMLSPYPIEVNQPRIRTLLGILSTPSFEQLPAPTSRLGEFGLEPPLATLQLDETRLLFGGTHPYNHRRYILLDQTLHLTNDLFPHHLLAGAEAFVSHRLLPTDSDITAIDTPRWSLRREAARQWRLEPDQGGSTTDQLQKKVDDWRNALASRLEKAPGGTASGEVQVMLRGKAAPLRFSLFEAAGELLLVRSDIGLAYHLPGTSHLLERPGAEP